VPLHEASRALCSDVDGANAALKELQGLGLESTRTRRDLRDVAGELSSRLEHDFGRGVQLRGGRDGDGVPVVELVLKVRLTEMRR
jgi:hypothetical protein